MKWGTIHELDPCGDVCDLLNYLVQFLYKYITTYTASDLPSVHKY